MAITVIISIVVGFLVGVLSGLLGVGGGTILVPIFSVFFGLAPVVATGTSLFTIFFTSISGAITRVRNKTCVIKVGVAMGLGGAVTSPLGAYLATLSPEIVVVIAVSLVILYSIVSTLRKALKEDKTSSRKCSDASDKGVSSLSFQVPSASAEGTDSTTHSAPVAQVDNMQARVFTGSLCIRSVLIGILAGFLSGYVGLGGGFLMIPLMRNMLGFTMKEASGTSLIGVLFIALTGSIAQISFGNVDFLIGIFIVVGSIPGAVVGSRLVQRINDRVLSFIFVGFLFVATLLFILKQVGLLG